MATLDPRDREVLLEDLKKQKKEISEDLHMEEIKALQTRTEYVRMILTQRHVIRILEGQLKDVQADVDNVYAPQYARKDRKAKDYLVYLLRMQEYRAKQCEKLKEKLKERENATREVNVRISRKNRELAKIIKGKMRQVSASKLLSLYENKLENVHHRLGEQTKLNRDQRENMRHLFIMRSNYFKLSEEFRKKNEQDMTIIKQHLNNAVKIYKNREDLVSKTGILSERLALDQQKTLSNSILLHRTKEKISKAEEFETVKMKERPDCRSAQIEALLRKGITGLEPDVETAQEIRAAITGITRTDDVDDMREMFRKSEQENYNDFYSIENLQKEICDIEDEVQVLRGSIHDIEKNLSEDQRICLGKIMEEQDKVERMNAGVDGVEAMKGNLISDLQSALDLVNEVISLPQEEKAPASPPDPTDEEYVYDALAAFEDRIADLLTAVQYLRTHHAQDQQVELKALARKSGQDDEDELQITAEDATAIGDKKATLYLAEDAIKQETSGSFVDRDSVLDGEDVQVTPSEAQKQQEIVEQDEYTSTEPSSGTDAN